MIHAQEADSLDDLGQPTRRSRSESWRLLRVAAERHPRDTTRGPVCPATHGVEHVPSQRRARWCTTVLFIVVIIAAEVYRSLASRHAARDAGLLLDLISLGSAALAAAAMTLRSLTCIGFRTTASSYVFALSFVGFAGFTTSRNLQLGSQWPDAASLAVATLALSSLLHMSSTDANVVMATTIFTGCVGSVLAMLAISPSIEASDVFIVTKSTQYTHSGLQRGTASTLVTAVIWLSMQSFGKSKGLTNPCAAFAPLHTDATAEADLGLRARSLARLRAAVFVARHVHMGEREAGRRHSRVFPSEPTRPAPRSRPVEGVMAVPEKAVRSASELSGAKASVAVSPRPTDSAFNPCGRPEPATPLPQNPEHPPYDAFALLDLAVEVLKATTLETRRKSASLMKVERGQLAMFYACAAAVFYMLQLIGVMHRGLTALLTCTCVVSSIRVLFRNNLIHDFARVVMRLPSTAVMLVWVAAKIGTDVALVLKDIPAEWPQLVFLVALTAMIVAALLLPAMRVRSPRIEAVVLFAGLTTQLHNLVYAVLSARPASRTVLLSLPYGDVTAGDADRIIYAQNCICLGRLIFYIVRDTGCGQVLQGAGKAGQPSRDLMVTNAAFAVATPLPHHSLQALCVALYDVLSQLRSEFIVRSLKPRFRQTLASFAPDVMRNIQSLAHQELQRAQSSRVSAVMGNRADSTLAATKPWVLPQAQVSAPHPNESSNP